jgi:hypothetical protein
MCHSFCCTSQFTSGPDECGEHQEFRNSGLPPWPPLRLSSRYFLDMPFTVFRHPRRREIDVHPFLKFACLHEVPYAYPLFPVKRCIIFPHRENVKYSSYTLTVVYHLLYDVLPILFFSFSPVFPSLWSPPPPHSDPFPRGLLLMLLVGWLGAPTIYSLIKLCNCISIVFSGLSFVSCSDVPDVLHVLHKL